MRGNNSNLSQETPSLPRLLHTMLRVSSLEKSLSFYIDALGMTEFRRDTYPEGRFTLAFVGYNNEASSAVIELTHNWDTHHYQHGSAFGHIAIGVSDIHQVCERLAAMKIEILRPPGPMSFTSQTGERELIAFVKDSDGYRIELIEIGR